MPSTSPSHIPRLLFSVVCVLSINLSAHACSATTQDVFSVGNKAADSSCNYGSIQDAINAATCAAGTKIILNQSGDYTNQHLSITNKNLTLVGRANAALCSTPLPACGVPPLYLACPTAPLRTIDGGSGGASGSGVITIRGASNVTLQYLTVSGGNHGGDGGGIDYSGTGTLTLATSSVADNTANYGGGINFKGSNGSAELHLDHTAVQFNTANVSGGGIRVEGSTRLIMVGTGSTILENKAIKGSGGFGGGLEILGPARADLAGYGALPPLEGNSADYGGGIAVIDIGNGEPVLRTFASGPAQSPMQITHNSAWVAGGALYLDRTADACLFATRVDGNDAPQGAAFYKEFRDVSDQEDAGFFINGGFPDRLGTECGPEPIANLGGSTGCAPDTVCSTIDANTADNATGAIIYVRESRVAGTQFRMQDNQAARVISTGGASVTLKRCLISDNVTSDVLLAVDYASGGTGSPESFDECTIAHNTIGGTYVFEFLESGSVGLSHDIIDAPGRKSVHFTPSPGAPGATLNAGYLMASETGTLPAAGNPSIVTGSPFYVDADHGDYHLAPIAQTAIDFAPATFADVDLDGHPAGIDLPSVPNTFGPSDLGAYERQPGACDMNDTIFCSGFEP